MRLIRPRNPRQHEPKRFINWTRSTPCGTVLDSGDYSPSNPKSVAWMTRFVMWATGNGDIVIFRKQDKVRTPQFIENT